MSNAASVTSEKRTLGGIETYCYEIQGDKAHYLAKVARHKGTVFALFAAAPVARWDESEAGLRRAYDTFQML